MSLITDASAEVRQQEQAKPARLQCLTCIALRDLPADAATDLQHLLDTESASHVAEVMRLIGRPMNRSAVNRHRAEHVDH